MKRAMVLVAVLSTAFAAVRPHLGSAQDTPRVAVLDFTGFMMGDGNAAVSLGKAIAAMLVTEFSGREGIQVVERAQLNEMLREQDLALSGRLDESSAVEIGRLLGCSVGAVKLRVHRALGRLAELLAQPR